MSLKPRIFYKKYNSDMLTPVRVYDTINQQFSKSLLFESVEKAAGRGRYSIIACHPDAVWQCQSTESSTITYYNEDQVKTTSNASCKPLEQLKTLYDQTKCELAAELPSAAAGLFGYFSYDAIRLVENIPQTSQDPLGIPDGYLFRPRIVIIFDSVYDSLYIISNNFDGETNDHHVWKRITNIEQLITQSMLPTALLSLDNNITSHQALTYHTPKSEFLSSVLKAQEYILAGDAFQIVLSQRFSVDFVHAQPLDFYRALRRVNPSPYMFYFSSEDFVLAGASPEILVRNENGTITIRPIAGTRPRGQTKQEDIALEQELLHDEKEVAEHLMLLDLGRNDVGRISEIGSVVVTDEYMIERYSHVMHIVSNVTGKLRKDHDFIDAFFSALPAGTVSGAPKIRAMEIIDELETEKRSFYAGGIGYFSSNGNGDFSIMLRTAMIKDQKIYFQAGAGVVADSNPESEYKETINKAAAIIKSLEIMNCMNQTSDKKA